jgi:hypothetical protein
MGAAFELEPLVERRHGVDRAGRGGGGLPPGLFGGRVIPVFAVAVFAAGVLCPSRGQRGS